MVRKLFSCAVIFLSFLILSSAKMFGQVELFGGYSYLHESASSTNANGWEASLSAHLLGPLGAEMDFSNHYGISPASAFPNYVPEFTEMYGPRFTFLRLPRVHLYAHALFGTVHGVRDQTSILPPQSQFGTPVTLVRQAAFGMAYGGGIDVQATRHVWIRLIQADYMRVQFSGNPQNDTRISAGLVFRFGRW